MSESAPIRKKGMLVAIIILSVSTVGLGTGFGISLVNNSSGPTYYDDGDCDCPDCDDCPDCPECDPCVLDPAIIAELEELYLMRNNTEFGGTFYVQGTISQNYDWNSKIISTTFGFDEYFYNRLEREHPSHSPMTPTAQAQTIASYCDTTGLYSLASAIRDEVTYSNDECILDGLLSFVQDRGEDEPCIHYTSDGATDFAKYPIETLCEGTGDCEDQAILFCSLAEALGYQCIIIVIPGHSFAGVKMDSIPTRGGGWSLTIGSDSYYTCECTSFGWVVGDLPPENQGQTAYYAFV